MTTLRRIDLAVQQKIEELALQGRSAAQIHRELDRQEEFWRRLPTLRTVQRVVKEITPRDSSGVWRLADSPLLAERSPNSDAALIMPVLAEVIERTEGKRKHLTRSEAAWVARVRTISPTLDMWNSYMLAVAYVRTTELKASTESLDVLLAYAPWQGKGNSERYVQAVEDGRAPAPWPYIGALRNSDGSVSDEITSVASNESLKIEFQEGQSGFTFEVEHDQTSKR